MMVVLGYRIRTTRKSLRDEAAVEARKDQRPKRNGGYVRTVQLSFSLSFYFLSPSFLYPSFSLFHFIALHPTAALLIFN